MRNIFNFSSWFLVTRFLIRQSIMKLLHTALKKPLAVTVVFSGLMMRGSGMRSMGLKVILKGRRIDDVAQADKIIRKIIRQNEGDQSEFRELLGGGPDRTLEFYEGRTLLLKLPVLGDEGLLEKGAIIFKFSETFIRMYLSLDVRLLSKYFRIIFEPSSSGYSAEEILSWTTIAPEKIIVFSPDDGDFQFLSDLDTNLVPMKLGAADWVNPKIFHKIKDVEKEFDAIYVANFNPVKRVDRYIRAVTRINRSRSDFRAALVCAIVGDARREILTMLEMVSDKANISFYDGMPQSDLNMLLNKSKVNMLLSLKEGANKGLSEGLFSGTPAILLDENTGVKRDNINDKTGKITPDAELEDTLIWFSEHHDEYRPDEWADEFLSPDASTKTLAEKLAELEAFEGRAWTVGLYPKVNQPELAYLHPEDDWLLQKRMALLNNFTAGADEKDILKFLEQLQGQRLEQKAQV